MFTHDVNYEYIWFPRDVSYEDIDKVMLAIKESFSLVESSRYESEDRAGGMMVNFMDFQGEISDEMEEELAKFIEDFSLTNFPQQFKDLLEVLEKKVQFRTVSPMITFEDTQFGEKVSFFIESGKAGRNNEFWATVNDKKSYHSTSIDELFKKLEKNK